MENRNIEETWFLDLMKKREIRLEQFIPQELIPMKK